MWPPWRWATEHLSEYLVKGFTIASIRCALEASGAHGGGEKGLRCAKHGSGAHGGIV